MTGPSTIPVLPIHMEHSTDLNAFLLNINEYRKNTKQLGKPLTWKTAKTEVKIQWGKKRLPRQCREKKP